MAYDGIVTKHIVSELKNVLIGGKINKIYEPNKNEILLGIYSHSINYCLNLSISSDSYRANLTTHAKSNPLNALGFCMLLRKHLIGGKITNIYTIGLERIIYIGGDMVKNPCNMLVKVGTSCNELLSQISLKRNDNVVLIMGGLMMGIPGDLNSTITANNNAVMIQSKKELKENSCLRCSKCIQNCPAYIEPVLIKDASHDELVKLHPEKCIECGICSYICPAKINLREKVINAKEEVKNEKVS